MLATSIVISGLLLLALLVAVACYKQKKKEAGHWLYITQHLRVELHRAQDVLDKYTLSDATTPLATRIELLAARTKRRPGCLDCAAAQVQQQSDGCKEARCLTGGPFCATCPYNQQYSAVQL